MSLSSLPTLQDIARYKFWLSHLFPIKIAQLNSEYNPDLKVLLHKGRLRLNAAHATYSFEDLYYTYYDSFKRLGFEQQVLKEVLVLGTGLGSVPLMLQQHFKQTSARYSCVDIDSTILKLAKHYLPHQVVKQCRFYEADAYNFVMHHQARYDLIVMDVFLDMETPAKFRSAAFINQLAALLHPNAYLLYNTLVIAEPLRQQSNQMYQQLFGKYFTSSQRYSTYGNQMLVGIK